MAGFADLVDPPDAPAASTPSPSPASGASGFAALIDQPAKPAGGQIRQPSKYSAADWQAASAASKFDDYSTTFLNQEAAAAKTPADRAAVAKTQAYTQAKIAQQNGAPSPVQAPQAASVMPTAPAAPTPNPNALSGAEIGFGDVGRLIAHGVTAAGSSLYGLVRAGGAMAGGGSLEDASNEITNAQHDYTYQPPEGSSAANLLQLAGAKYSPLTLLNKGTGALGDFALEQLQKDQRFAPLAPALATAADVGTNALAQFGAGKLAGKALSGDGTAAVAPPRVEPKLENPAPAQATGPIPGAPAAAPTLAQASPELRAGVQQFEAKNGPADPAIVARHVEADTLPVPGRLTAGQAAQDPAMISNEMNSRGKGQAAPVPPEFYQAQGQTLAKNMGTVRASAAPDIPTDATMVDHGQTQIDAYKAKAAAADANTTSLYKQLSDANGGALPLNGQDFVAAADAALSKQMKGRYVPPAVAGDLDDLRNGGPMTFENFENMRTNLAAEGRKAERAGDGNAAGAVNIVRNALEQMPMTDETGAIKPLADAARGAAKAQFDALRSDPAYKAAVSDPTPMGDASPLADKFFRNYVINAPTENVARMSANLADNPAAIQSMAAGTIDHLTSQLKADPVTGNFRQDSYNKALDSLSPKLGSLVDPVTGQQLGAIGGFAKNAQTQPRGSWVNNSNSATSLLAEGAKSASEHGTNMLFGGLPVGTVVRKVGGTVADTLANKKATTDAIKPGAGLRVNLEDLTK